MKEFKKAIGIGLEDHYDRELIGIRERADNYFLNGQYSRVIEVLLDPSCASMWHDAETFCMIATCYEICNYHYDADDFYQRALVSSQTFGIYQSVKRRCAIESLESGSELFEKRSIIQMLADEALSHRSRFEIHAGMLIVDSLLKHAVKKSLDLNNFHLREYATNLRGMLSEIDNLRYDDEEVNRYHLELLRRVLSLAPIRHKLSIYRGLLRYKRNTNVA